MNPLNAGPLDVLRACAGFWPLEQRLACEALSRRWLEAVRDAELWSDLEARAAVLAALPAVLARHGHRMRRLAVLGVSTSPAAWVPRLCACDHLMRLELVGLRAADFTRSVDAAGGLLVPSLRSLALEFAPYFILGHYSHHAGLRAATVKLDWVARAFPALEDLACDYLRLCGGAGSKDEEAESAAAVVGPSSPPSSLLPRLRALSLVAVVRREEDAQPSLWNTRNCSRDLSAVATALPQLERLGLRDPQLSLVRMCRRPGQSTEELIRMCRRFCATDPEQLRGACRLLPSLRRLEVATLLDVGEADGAEADLAELLGFDRASVAAFSSGDSSSSGPLQVYLGGAGGLARRWRAAEAARRGGSGIVVEVEEEGGAIPFRTPCPDGASPPFRTSSPPSRRPTQMAVPSRAETRSFSGILAGLASGWDGGSLGGLSSGDDEEVIFDGYAEEGEDESDAESEGLGDAATAAEDAIAEGVQPAVALTAEAGSSL